MKQKKYIFDLERFSADLLTKRVVELRLGLREVAEQIGISAATLSRLENKNIPDVYTYFYCCKWLEKDMMEYFKPERKKK